MFLCLVIDVVIFKLLVILMVLLIDFDIGWVEIGL